MNNTVEIGEGPWDVTTVRVDYLQASKVRVSEGETSYRLFIDHWGLDVHVKKNTAFAACIRSALEQSATTDTTICTELLKELKPDIILDIIAYARADGMRSGRAAVRNAVKDALGVVTEDYQQYVDALPSRADVLGQRVFDKKATFAEAYEYALICCETVTHIAVQAWPDLPAFMAMMQAYSSKHAGDRQLGLARLRYRPVASKLESSTRASISTAIRAIERTYDLASTAPCGEWNKRLQMFCRDARDVHYLVREAVRYRELEDLE